MYISIWEGDSIHSASYYIDLHMQVYISIWEGYSLPLASYYIDLHMQVYISIWEGNSIHLASYYRVIEIYICKCIYRCRNILSVCFAWEIPWKYENYVRPLCCHSTHQHEQLQTNPCQENFVCTTSCRGVGCSVPALLARRRVGGICSVPALLLAALNTNW